MLEFVEHTTAKSIPSGILFHASQALEQNAAGVREFAKTLKCRDHSLAKARLNSKKPIL